MMLRPWNDADAPELLLVTREPMEGKIALSWGLSELAPPPCCTRLGGGVVDYQGHVRGCALYWHWPDGSRYLSTLRFSRQLPVHPSPAAWNCAFTAILDGVTHAWTSIGADNIPARRILERGIRSLPLYQPCQPVSTWFIPLAGSQRNAEADDALDRKLGLQSGDFRYVSVPSGKGVAYQFGRMLYRLGLPGIPGPSHRLRIGFARPSTGLPAEEAARLLVSSCRKARGYDGIVVVLPQDSQLAAIWKATAPRLSWCWQSTLYCVSWERLAVVPPIPAWDGAWL